MPSLKCRKRGLRLKIEDTEFSANGKDDIEFLISTNLGEMPKPLSKKSRRAVNFRE
ncbi:MAG: hypothetical protein L6V93_10795 [Clostridiales bacterium]|nr:MAG: hypothetical protein L6V93_10795 [Clostridiales bacterium]